MSLTTRPAPSTAAAAADDEDDDDAVMSSVSSSASVVIQRPAVVPCDSVKATTSDVVLPAAIIHCQLPALLFPLLGAYSNRLHYTSSLSVCLSLSVLYGLII